MRQQTNHHWFRQWLVAWTAPSHYLNQCRNILNLTPRNKLQWNFNRYSNIFIQENPFQNVVWKMAAILSRPQCVNTGNSHAWKMVFILKRDKRCQRSFLTCDRWQSCTPMGTYQHTLARTPARLCSDKCARRGYYILFFGTGTLIHQQIQEYKILART